MCAHLASLALVGPAAARLRDRLIVLEEGRSNRRDAWRLQQPASAAGATTKGAASRAAGLTFSARRFMRASVWPSVWFRVVCKA